MVDRCNRMPLPALLPGKDMQRSQLHTGKHINFLTTVTLFRCPLFLQSLKLLSLADNVLTSLPREVSAMTSLRKLFLYGNRLVQLPTAELEQLQSLDNLWLEGNPLEGEVVAGVLAAAAALPQMRALGLDERQVLQDTGAAGPEGSEVRIHSTAWISPLK